MCCSTEAGILKDALRPFLNREGREVDVSFDLVNAKLIVERRSGTLPTTEEIIKEVEKTGMQAGFLMWSSEPRVLDKRYRSIH